MRVVRTESTSLPARDVPASTKLFVAFCSEFEHKESKETKSRLLEFKLLFVSRKLKLELQQARLAKFI